MNDNLWEVHLGDDFQTAVCSRHAAEIIKAVEPTADPTVDYINDQTGIWIVEDVFGQIEHDKCWDCEQEAADA